MRSGKCYLTEDDPVRECVRFYYSSYDSVQQLCAAMARDFQLRAEECVFRYRDADGDYVLVTPHCTMEELHEHALSLHVYPKRLSSPVQRSATRLGEIDAAAAPPSSFV